MLSNYYLYSGISFESSASEGAILAMPHGLQAQDLANLSIFRRYLSTNMENWYRYVNNVRGREARNGDVRLVIGCDKTSSWGVATFANSSNREISFRFRPNGETQNYIWDCPGIVEARVGPDRQETEILTAHEGQPRILMNQCLFVRTLNATLCDDAWRRLGFDFETVTNVQYDTYPNRYIPTSPPPPATSNLGCSSCITTPLMGPEKFTRHFRPIVSRNFQ